MRVGGRNYDLSHLLHHHLCSILAVVFITIIVLFEYTVNPNDIPITFPKNSYVEDLFKVHDGGKKQM